MIATLPHPAAVFWGSDLCIVHNIAWCVAWRDEKCSGKIARECFPQDGLKALESTLSGYTVEVRNETLLKSTPQHSPDAQMLLCPLLDEKGSRYGVLAQLLQQTRPTTFLDDHVQADVQAEQSGQPTSQGRSDEKDDPSNKTAVNMPVASDDNSDDSVNVSLKENRWFRRFAQMLPTGLAILDQKAEALFVNDNFYKLTTRTSSKAFRAWPESIHPEDYKTIMLQYQDAIERNQELHVEFRCSEAEYATSKNVPWRVLLMRPLIDQVQKSGFLCAVVDVTEIKAAETAQRDLAMQEQQRRKQQESFIDMVSHEIRNPLSAIFGSAGEIGEAAEKIKARHPGVEDDEIDRVKEATETILLCAQHQNSLVDDILSFSKLSAEMLSLAPHPIQPSVGFAKSCRLFNSEMKNKDIEFDYVLDVSYRDIGIDYVMADEHRLRQVLVNLMSNAIKFIARKDGKRKISLALGATKERPSSYPPNVVFFESESSNVDATSTEEWGTGETVYFVVSVKDTGIGMSDAEQKELFRKFRQATPRTQERYGGSGLGLFISRKLCQLHGGEIGVASQYGKGSTFAFFFKAKRTSKPDEIPKTPDVEHGRPGSSMASRPGPDEKSDAEPRTVKEPEAYFDISLERFAQTARNAMELEGSKGTLHMASPKEGTVPSKIFLVEDNEINAKVLSRQLRNKGFSIMTAHNGEEAVGMFKRISSDIATQEAEEGMTNDNRPPSGGFDCILMDQEMPIKDGMTATREIREVNRYIPILGISANAREEQVQNMLDAGMNDVVSKPFKLDEVVSKIRGLIKNVTR